MIIIIIIIYAINIYYFDFQVLKFSFQILFTLILMYLSIYLMLNVSQYLLLVIYVPWIVRAGRGWRYNRTIL